MSELEKEAVGRFIAGIQNLMLGMQQVDSSCMEIFGEVTKRDFSLLVMLGQEQGMIMREVANFLQVPMSTATGIVDKLIEKGLVKRDYSSEDRRIVIIQLSDNGMSIYKVLNDKLFEFGAVILQNFDVVEREKFIEYMEQASNITSSMIGQGLPAESK